MEKKALPDRLKKCETAEELRKIAAGEQVELTPREAEEALAAIRRGELPDWVIGSAAGGFPWYTDPRR